MKIWVVLIGALASASPLFAQEPTPPLVPQHSQTIMDTLMNAGPVMIPLFLLSIIYVADIGMIAPLLGLLGTVFGIIHSFGALGADIGSARYVALSRGISEALVNTSAGLAIGIPAMMFYAFFRGRAQKLISELEAASTHVLALLSLQYGRPQRTPVLIEEEL